jgi:hypothetical protein
MILQVNLTENPVSYENTVRASIIELVIQQQQNCWDGLCKVGVLICQTLKDNVPNMQFGDGLGEIYSKQLFHSMTTKGCPDDFTSGLTEPNRSSIYMSLILGLCKVNGITFAEAVG